MIDKFKKGDKVLKVGTISPIMTIMGKLVKSGLPEYSVVEDMWTCEWTENVVFNRTESFKESELELFIDSEKIKKSETDIN